MRRKAAILVRALRTLLRFPLRSGLTILSAALGVAGALTSVNYALGGRSKITEQLNRLGTNVLTITPRASRTTGGRARTGTLVTTLTPRDQEAIRREVPMISRVSAYFVRSFPVKAGEFTKKSCVVVGIEPAFPSIRRWSIQTGLGFTQFDMRRMARVALLGASVARDFFGDSQPVGNRILINRVPFEVAGVFSERGQSLDAANEDNQIYVPLTTAMRRLSNADYYSGILLAATGWERMDSAADAVTAVLQRRHVTVARAGPDFQVQNQKQLIDTQIAASAQLLAFVRWIALSALCVSGLGILGISWISVRERTREIGTRRALGATRVDIFSQIVWESISLSVVGCAVGALTADASSVILAKWVRQPQIFDSPSAWLAISVACLLNVIFAAVPARNAAMLDPIQALRFE